MKKRQIITILVITVVIALAIFMINRNKNGISEDTALCIGNNSVIYTQLGCHACAVQEEIFGSNYKYLTKIDCFFEREKCLNITATPTWVINGRYYIGVKKINELKELTECN